MRILRRLVAHEVRAVISMGLWLARRKHGVGPGDRAFGYSRGEISTMLLFLFGTLLEGVALSYLIPWPAVHQAWLALHVYSVLLILGLIAANLTRPHVIGTRELRIRYGAAFDLRVPLELVSSVRRSSKLHDSGLIKLADERLEVILSSQTNVLIELSEPILVTRPLGRTGTARTIRLKVDDPADFTRELADRCKCG